ncbi:hypothetical protein AHX05_22970, partial [Salmonella enterica subsp. indica]|nr:hypothetical protein [Salmonella enterica subsp. indica]
IFKYKKIIDIFSMKLLFIIVNKKQFRYFLGLMIPTSQILMNIVKARHESNTSPIHTIIYIQYLTIGIYYKRTRCVSDQE